MKEKTLNALHAMFKATSEDLGFFFICGIALFILLKLACV